MPVVRGRVGEKSVDVLRDTGCSGTVVKRDLVSEDQFTGDFNVMLLIDNTGRKVPIAKIDIGNVPGARTVDDSDRRPCARSLCYNHGSVKQRRPENASR